MDRDIEEDVERRIKAGWLRSRLAFGVLCDWCMPTRLKENFFWTTIRLAMTYGAEYCKSRSTQAKNECSKAQKVEVDVG